MLRISQRLGPCAAALLNSTFIQGFELDDYHSDAPLHSNSILLPALIAAAEHTKTAESPTFDGAALLLATIVGYEIGPRVGLGLYGAHMLSRGWHSGAVFGAPAAAASVSKLLNLSSPAIEDAMGIACTQACGLMAAQYESMVKRMQHGFAARNGLFAALMAQGGYKGIERIFERPYGGYLAAFGQGSGRTPEYLVDEVAKELGETWQLRGIRVKPYAALASTHNTIDCVRALQDKYPSQLQSLHSIRHINIEMAEPAFKHGGWEAKRPLNVTGAQMSSAYVAALQLVDGQVLPAQFRHDQLDRDSVWQLVGMTTCSHNVTFDEPGRRWNQRVTIQFNGDMSSVAHFQSFPKGVDPPLTNDEILMKWRFMTGGVIDKERQRQIEKVVLELDNVQDITELTALLADKVKSAID